MSEFFKKKKPIRFNGKVARKKENNCRIKNSFLSTVFFPSTPTHVFWLCDSTVRYTTSIKLKNYNPLHSL